MGKRKPVPPKCPKGKEEVNDDFIVEDSEIGAVCKEGFRWENIHYHLTYKGHQDFEELKALAKAAFGDVIGWSIVHETSDKDNEYEHTHFYFLLGKKPQRRGNIMDIHGVHPHVRKIRNPKHANAIFKYHQKAPVKVEQEGKEKIPSFGDGNKEAWADIVAMTKKGNWEAIEEKYPGQFVRSRRAIMEMCAMKVEPPKAIEKLANFWVFGEPNTGKSTLAQKFFEDNYPGEKVYWKEARSKWFDGITSDHSCLLIEDPDRQDFERPGFWKRLLDKFPIRVETKGSSVVIRPKCIIITSNHAPEDCFSGVDLAAMMSRMVVKRATKVYAATKGFDEEKVERMNEVEGIEDYVPSPCRMVSQKDWDGEQAREKRQSAFLDKKNK